MESLNIAEHLLALLVPGVYKTTAQLVQEFRMEFPLVWRELEAEGHRLFGGACGAYQQPATRIGQVLFNLPPEKCLRRRDGEGYSWSAPGAGPPDRGQHPGFP